MSKAYPNIGFVLLAAGTSSRFGKENKLLHEVNGEAMVRRVVKTLLTAGVGELLVVLGHEADAVREVLGGLGVETVLNPDFGYGMGGSVALGVKRIRELGVDAALLCLSDLPYLEVETVRAVVESFKAKGGERIAYPVAKGMHGHPVCFPKRCFAGLELLVGDRGARGVIRNDLHPVVEVVVADEGCIHDVDFS